MVETSPHGEGDVRDHINTEYDTDSDGIIENDQIEALRNFGADVTWPNPLTHGGEVDTPAEAHHNQVDDESGTFNQAANTESETTVNFGQAYATGVGETAFSGALSPVADADSVIVAYTTDGNGNIDGMTIRAHNTTGAQETVRWRFAGRPV